jgi:hypothetical protein
MVKSWLFSVDCSGVFGSGYAASGRRSRAFRITIASAPSIQMDLESIEIGVKI